MSIKTGIFGAAGYTGWELIGILHTHPAMSIHFAVSDTNAGEMVGINGLKYVKQHEAALNEVDLVFLCTPHLASAPLAAKALDAGAKVVDLSADLRLKTPESFAKWYQHEHPVPALLPTVYGLPELNRHEIVGQAVIANPGCYPTSSILGLAPLAKAGALKPGAPLIIDAKSGVSGAGKNPKPDLHFVEIFGDFKPYNIGRTHRHTGEIEQELHALAPTAGPIIFSPHLLPVDRGILSTIYAPLADGWDYAKARELYTDLYADELLVKVLPEGQTARLKDAVRTNRAVISLTPAAPDLLIIVSVIDNLRKGAASQAVQNANIMFGLPETAGLLEN